MKITKPPMGFNTWNTFGSRISDELICSTADKIVELGLDKLGYEYIVIDDCWQEKSRDENGHIVPNKQKFPRGIKPVADYVHSKGLKFGIYTCVGNRTCGDFPGSYEHDFIDAADFAEWGVDYLKVDYCFKPEHDRADLLYKRMGLALANCGRDIVFSACNWGKDDAKMWMRETGAHLWRTGGDISDVWQSIEGIFEKNLDKVPYNSPVCYNDMDMLIVGMNGEGAQSLGGCTLDEYKTHFAVWCMFQSPLMIGCDIRKIDDDSLAILKNKGIIDICCDEGGFQPYLTSAIGRSGCKAQVWARHLENGDLAILMINMTDAPTRGFVAFSSMALNASCGVCLDIKELYSGEEFTGVKGEFFSDTIPVRGCRIYRAKLRRI